MSLSTPKARDFAELAIPLIRRLVTLCRAHGITTPQAEGDVAHGLGVTFWRVSSLFHRREALRPVYASEWDRLRMRGSRMLRLEAVRLRALADALEVEADALESRQLSGQGDAACERRSAPLHEQAA